VGILHKLRRSEYWIREIAQHPANQGARLAAVRRAAAWHWHTRGEADVEAMVMVDRRTTIRVRPHQFSSVWTLYNGIHEWEELQFCFGFLRAGDQFIDVGANVGIFSTLVGTRIPGVAITAIEPFPPARHDLESNLALNQLQIPVVASAVSETSGEATFEILERDVLNRLAPGGAVGATHTGIQVEVTTLDELLPEASPSLIKIDVEGSELLVLRGSRRLLAEHSPVLLFEHCGHGAQFGITPADMQVFLHEVGYHLYLLDGDLTPWESDELPPTLNVVAARDVELVRARLAAPSPGAVAVPPVRVQVTYQSSSVP
jgi:FkbM family methyltransferase